MFSPVSRRDFLKTAGWGSAAAALAVMPPGLMPEAGQSIAPTLTTCGECPAGCGLHVQVEPNWGLDVQGNPNHPVNAGRLCPRAVRALNSLASPARVEGPLMRSGRGWIPLDWQAARQVVQLALDGTGEAAFLLGLFPDHLASLVAQLAQARGRTRLLRYSAAAELSGRTVLRDAVRAQVGEDRPPQFDLASSQAVWIIGAGLPAPDAWQAHPAVPGWIEFSPRHSLDHAKWVTIRPGSEARLAQLLARLLAPPSDAFPDFDLLAAAGTCGVDLPALQDLLEHSRPALVIPGTSALGGRHAVQTAQTILALNHWLDGAGFLLPSHAPLFPAIPAANTLAEMQSLIQRMHMGKVHTLFIHGIDPMVELPPGLDFATALQRVPQVISFTSFYDSTAPQAHYIFPDHLPLESGGYQVTGIAGRTVVSAVQASIAPQHNTCATADLLLAAVQGCIGLRDALPYENAAAFLQHTLEALAVAGGYDSASGEFQELWRQRGGWWQAAGEAAVLHLGQLFALPVLQPGDDLVLEETDFILLPFEPGEAIRVDQQPVIEVHPSAALRYGLVPAQRVQIVSSVGSLEVKIHLNEALHPSVIALPHPAVLTLLEPHLTQSGTWAYTTTRCRIQLHPGR